MNSRPEDPNEATARRARADLTRLQQQSEKVLGAPSAERPLPDDGDAVEVWGKRIGLGLSLLLGVYVLYWFYTAIFL